MYQKDDRVELIHMNDEYTRLEAGLQGTVTMVDALGTIHVKWDNGSRLGVVEEAGDRIRKIT